jgi:hypothetical protein
MVLLRPSDFFSRLNLRGNEHWSFIVVLGWPLGALGAVLQALCLFAYAGLFVGTASANDLPEMMAGTVFSALFVPVQLLLGVVIGGAVLHLFLRLVGGANAGIETTFRTYAYTGAVALITWVPFLGPLVGGIWQLVLILIGLKHMHDTTYGKVVLAVLVPVAIVTAVAAAVAGLFFLTGGMMGP